VKDERPFDLKLPLFPWFVIGYSSGDFFVVSPEGRDCLMFYGQRELAELYLSDPSTLSQDAEIIVIDEATSAINLLMEAKQQHSIQNTLWDATPKPTWFKIVPLDDLLNWLNSPDADQQAHGH